MSISRAQEIMDQAISASRGGDFPKALQLFDEAAQASPGNAIPHYLMGAEYAQLGQMVDAEAAFARAVLLDPGLHMARFQLGLLQYTERRVAVAMMTWKPLSELPASEPLNRFVFGLAALARDEFDEARARLLEGIAANTAHPPLNADMRMVLARIDALQGRAPTEPSGDAAAAPDGDTHVLLSNYQQQGPAN